jgi:hypothetical protein
MENNQAKEAIAAGISPEQMLKMMPVPSTEVTVLYHEQMYSLIRRLTNALVSNNNDAGIQVTGEMVDFVFNVFAGSVPDFVGEQTPNPSEGYIKLPTSQDEAQAMIRVGYMWLDGNTTDIAGKKAVVSDLMKLATQLRHAPTQDYDSAFRELQTALYQVIPNQAANT